MTDFVALASNDSCPAETLRAEHEAAAARKAAGRTSESKHQN